MENNEENVKFSMKTCNDMIYLLACLSNKEVPDQKVIEHIVLEELYQLAKYHNLAAMVCMALEATDIFRTRKEEQLIRKWKEAKEKAVRKSMMLDIERQEITKFMEKEGIWYMPLKGIIIKELYPRIGMREMADNDILYDKSYQKELLGFMKERGYKAIGVGRGNHDVYMKPPVYNFELHTALFNMNTGEKWVSYYSDIKEKLIKDDNNSFGYHFKEEDSYIYMMTHGYKHYNSGGTGLRTLLDIYIYLNKKETELDWSYISKESKKLGIDEFEQESRMLSKKLFTSREAALTQKETKMLQYYLNAGSYGTLEHKVANDIRKHQKKSEPVTKATKLKYYIRRLFPDESYYAGSLPFFHKHKFLRPLYVIYRLIRGVTIRRKNITNEIKAVNKVK